MTKARDIASATPAPSTVSATELGYLDGVSSAIQTQIDSKIGSASAINPTIIAAKGDLIVGTANDTVGILSKGTDTYTLVADSAEATGLKWAAPSGSTESWSLFNAGGTALTGATTVTVSGISGVNQIMVLVVSASSATAGSRIAVRLNGDTASNYYVAGSQNTYESTYSSVNFARMAGLADDRFFISRVPSSTAAEAVAGTVLLKGCNGTGLKIASTFGGGNGGSGQESFIGAGYYNSSSTISSVSVVSQSGNLDNGTVYVYTSVA